jgi:hypothetical protein
MLLQTWLAMAGSWRSAFPQERSFLRVLWILLGLLAARGRGTVTSALAMFGLTGRWSADFRAFSRSKGVARRYRIQPTGCERQKLVAPRTTFGSLWEGTRHREQHLAASGTVGRRHASGPGLGRRQAWGPGRTITQPPAGKVGMGRNVQTAEESPRMGAFPSPLFCTSALRMSGSQSDTLGGPARSLCKPLSRLQNALGTP